MRTRGSQYEVCVIFLRPAGRFPEWTTAARNTRHQNQLPWKPGQSGCLMMELNMAMAIISAALVSCMGGDLSPRPPVRRWTNWLQHYYEKTSALYLLEETVGDLSAWLWWRVCGIWLFCHCGTPEGMATSLHNGNLFGISFATSPSSPDAAQEGQDYWDKPFSNCHCSLR